MKLGQVLAVLVAFTLPAEVIAQVDTARTGRPYGPGTETDSDHATAVQPQSPVIIRVAVDGGGHELTVGDSGSIVFTMDANGSAIGAVTFPMLFVFNNGNVIGQVRVDTEFVWSPAASVFGIRPFGDQYSNPTDPDTLQWGASVGGPGGWIGADELVRITFLPLDTGFIVIDSTLLPPGNRLEAFDTLAGQLAIDWQVDTIRVVPWAPSDTAIIRVSTFEGNDTLYAGTAGLLVFEINSNGAEIGAVTFPLEFSFSNGNIVGPVDLNSEFYFENLAAGLEQQTFYSSYSNPTDPDTLLWDAVDTDSSGWTYGASRKFARLGFEPTDTGLIIIDSLTLPGGFRMEVLDLDSMPLGLDWQPDTIHVVPFVPDTLVDALVFIVFNQGVDSLAKMRSPVHMVVTDPNGDSIGVEPDGMTVFDSIGGTARYVIDTLYNNDTLVAPLGLGLIDSLPDEAAILPNPLSGTYTARFFADPGGIDPGDKFTQAIRINGSQLEVLEVYEAARVPDLIDSTIPPEREYEVLTIRIGPDDSVAVHLAGDVNADGTRNAQDIIDLVNYVFKSGTPPIVPLLGDVDCSGDPEAPVPHITATDVIYMVRFVFKGDVPPCSRTAG